VRSFAHVLLYTHRIGFLRRPLQTFLFLRLFTRNAPWVMDGAGRIIRLTPKIYRRCLTTFLLEKMRSRSLLRNYRNEIASSLTALGDS